MSYRYNPDDFGPGKPITGEMSEVYLRENCATIIILLMLRLKSLNVLIGEDDLAAMAAQVTEGSALGVIPVAEGLRLFVAGPGTTSALKTK